MKTTVNFSDFHNAFKNMNREDNFTYEGLRALFDYIEEYEQETGEEVELDVIAICCEFSEYDDIKQFQDNYGDEYQTIEDIQDATTCIPVGNFGFIIQDF